MENIELQDEFGTKIYGCAIATIETVEIGVIGSFSAVSISKEQARQLGQWLIENSK